MDVTEGYVWDVAAMDGKGNVILDFVDEYDGQADPWDLKNVYLWGQAVDQLFAQEDFDWSATPDDVKWALTDNLGSVRDLAEYDEVADETNIVNHLTYQAFGKVTSQTNLAEPNTAAVDALFQFTGRPFDEYTGLQNNHYRWYDHITGKWMSQDPIEHDKSNNDRYVNNNPTNNIDPSGLRGEGISLAYATNRAKGHRQLAMSKLRQLGEVTMGGNATQDQIEGFTDEIQEHIEGYHEERMKAWRYYGKITSSWWDFITLAVNRGAIDELLKLPDSIYPDFAELDEAQLRNRSSELQQILANAEQGLTSQVNVADRTIVTLQRVEKTADTVTLALGGTAIIKQGIKCGVKHGAKGVGKFVAVQLGRYAATQAAGYIAIEIGREAGLSDQQLDVGMKVYQLVTLRRQLAKMTCFVEGTPVIKEESPDDQGAPSEGANTDAVWRWDYVAAAGALGVVGVGALALDRTQRAKARSRDTESLDRDESENRNA